MIMNIMETTRKDLICGLKQLGSHCEETFLKRIPTSLPSNSSLQLLDESRASLDLLGGRLHLLAKPLHLDVPLLESSGQASHCLSRVLVL